MGCPSLTTFYLAWGPILLLNISSAVSFPDSSIIEATKEKYNLLRSRHLQSSSSDTPLTLEQFDSCMTDLKLADSNADSQLDKSEYLLFLSMNSAKYGYAWGDASNQFSLSELPLEFAMLFHSTACMCAYEQDSASVDFGCCQGANEHVVIYADSGSNMTEEQETYSRLFCSEAYNSYSSTSSPTKSPLAMTMPPNIMSPSPIVSTITPTTVAPGASPPTPTMTSPPVMPLTASPTQRVPTIPPNTVAPGATSSPTPTMTSPPVMALTASPTQRVPSIPPNTVAPGATSSPTPTMTSPPVMALTASPTQRMSTFPPNTVGPGTFSPTPTMTTPTVMPPTASSTILEIDIEYGISSDCGMTAYDVMNGNYGITIKEGLITAAETVLVDILNSTYPREAPTEGVVETTFPESIPTMPPVTVLDSMPPVANSGSIPTMPPVISSFSIPTMPPAAGGEDPSAMTAETTNKNFLKTVRIRVEGLPSAPVKVGHDDPYTLRRGLAMLSVPEGQPQSLRGDHWPLNKHHQLQKGFRSLVYYTEQNPVIITNIEDVSDQSCPIGIVCMKVQSTLFVTLEEGDVANDVEAVIRNGVELSLEDYSFFDSMPDDTIVCPPPFSASPIPIPPNSSEPTSHSPTPVVFPTTSTPTYIPISTSEPTSPPVLSLTPVAIPTTPPPIAATPTTLMPFHTAVTESPSLVSEEDTTGPMNVTIQYNFDNDCGLDAEAIMNEEGNTFKDVLVDVTTAATIQILNETFPRVNEEEPARRRGFRGLVHLDNPSSTSFFSGQRRRNLVYYTDEYPVTIDRIIDIESCDPGFSCLLVISTIIVVLEAGDDPTQVNDAIVSGIADSFSDGSIYGTVPPESLECPSV